jgi:hypothetical protein
MPTINRKTLEIQPGEQATAYVPLPLGVLVDRVDVDPSTAASFRIVRADYIGPSAMLAETGMRSAAVRVVLENTSTTARAARIFVDFDRSVAVVGRELEGVAETFNRTVFNARRRRGVA